VLTSDLRTDDMASRMVSKPARSGGLFHFMANRSDAAAFAKGASNLDLVARHAQHDLIDPVEIGRRTFGRAGREIGVALRQFENMLTRGGSMPAIGGSGDPRD
jgi:hypothetical protein